MMKGTFLRYIRMPGILLLLSACSGGKDWKREHTFNSDFFLVVLGVAQDGGYPHAGCTRNCCETAHRGKQAPASPVCLGIVDRANKKVYMLEATPAFPEQWRRLQYVAGSPEKRAPDGIFLTHAHIGHYTGLMFLGREVMGTANTPVYALPRMAEFLRTNGPWSQLVNLKNIDLQGLQADSTIHLPGGLRITPFTVPHRDEFSETAGFRIETPRKKALFIPDIDKWSKWDRDIVAEVRSVDYALVDATFFRDGELQGRAMSEVPHPFVEETMQLFDNQPAKEKSKVTFIHFNHTNPLLWDKKVRKDVWRRGFSLAAEGAWMPL